MNIARESAPPVQWHDQQNVQNTYAVASQFTSAGWSRAQHALADLPRLLNRETWVLENVIPEGDRRRIELALRERYARDYTAAWTQFLDAGRVPAFANLSDAATRLSVLSRPTSPLIGMIRLASNNTAVDTLQMTRSFAPAHALATPNSQDPAEAAGKYLQTLNKLTEAVNLEIGRASCRERV